MPQNAPEPRRNTAGPPGGGGNRGNVAALVVVVVIAAALLWTFSAIRSHNAVQNCMDSGRKDCLGDPAGAGQ